MFLPKIVYNPISNRVMEIKLSICYSEIYEQEHEKLRYNSLHSLSHCRHLELVSSVVTIKSRRFSLLRIHSFIDLDVKWVKITICLCSKYNMTLTSFLSDFYIFSPSPRDIKKDSNFWVIHGNFKLRVSICFSLSLRLKVQTQDIPGGKGGKFGV